MNVFQTSWASALSMTLLHSLWQGLLITACAAVLLKLLSGRNSSTKYLIKTAAFFLVFVSCVVTFILLSNISTEHITVRSNHNHDIVLQQFEHETNAASAFLSTITQFLQINQSIIVMGWIVGVVIFSLRFVSGIAYVNYLRINASPVTGEWNTLLNELSKKSGVSHIVKLLESISVQTPLVVGYIKPIILMPVGLLSNLGIQQVEVILIHELAHIKRHDYLVNFIQSLGETIFFFNPFVWILSAWIRDERENCCDDMVLAEGYDPKLYATTLFELETSRADHKLALALTGNKNQLLNRIKRIMERSAKKQNGKEKFIPIVLLVLGLVFASWLSINPKEDQTINDNSSSNEEVAADTAKQSKGASYSRKSIITYDEKGVPHEDVVENFEGDEELRSMMTAPMFDISFDSTFRIPDMRELGVIDIPGFPTVGMMDFTMPDMAFMADTLPEVWNGWDEEKMKAFEKEFEAEFKSKFGDFYAKNQKEMEKMMADVQKKVSKLDHEWQNEFHARMEEDMKRVEGQMKQLAPIHEDQMRVAEEEMRRAGREMERVGREMNKVDELMKLNELDMSIMEEKMKEQEGIMKEMEKNMEAFNQEVKTELVKDGYLGKNEKIETLNFSDDGKITVNGKSIKATDQKKYSELHKKYFNHPERRRYSRPE